MAPRSMGVPPVPFGVSPKIWARKFTRKTDESGGTPEATGVPPMLRGDESSFPKT